jgi:Family of unknown function (DUF6529)
VFGRGISGHHAEVDQTAVVPRRSGRVPLIALLCGAVVAVLPGVNDRRHPGGSHLVKFGFPSVIEFKTVTALGIGVLLLVQLSLALWMYGRLGRPSAPGWVGPLHRTVGVIAVVVSLPVAYDCLLAFGIQTYEPRVTAHALLGCAVYGAFVVKVFAVRGHGSPRWFLPVAGGVFFALFVAAVLTSAVWYSAEYGFPTGNEY